ncbi:MAG TPA: glycosyltransferase [Vicinamibacteria bacterium]
MPHRGRLASSVSVVIPVLNASRTLPLLFEALDCLAPAPREVLLVDNGSSDESLSLLRSFAGAKSGRARVLQEPKRGATAARNAGIRDAAGDIIAFTDADCSPDPAWLTHLTAPYQDPSVGAVAGRVMGAPAETALEIFSALYTLRLPETPSRHREWTPRAGGFPTANFSVRRVLANELGGFDERVVIYGEDYDFCARLYERGVTIAYVPEAAVVHHHRVTVGGMMKQAFGFGRGHAFLFRRHGAGLWMDLPGRHLDWRSSPVHAWLDFASADKKVLAILIASLLYPPLIGLLAFYALYLVGSTERRARRAQMKASVWTSTKLAWFLILKSASLTAGRWWGSVIHRAPCL